MRILFIALSESIHTARWVSQLQNQNWDIHLFPADTGSLHPKLCNISLHNLFRQPHAGIHLTVKQTGFPWPLRIGRTRAEKLAASATTHFSRARRLARLIRGLRPDLIHILEMQRAGYLFLQARAHLSPFDSCAPVIYSSWGSDIFHFGKQAKHSDRIRAFLEACDYYIADCNRDVDLARNYGFKGKVLGVVPVGGGFEPPSPQIPPHLRRTIVLKGYEGGEWGGRAGIALEAISSCAKQLREFEIVVYSASASIRERVSRISLSSGLTFRLLSCSHDEMMKLFGRSRIAIGLSVTDGTPNSMLESMLMGAFPIQSDTISTREWIVDGDNGSLVPPEDSTAVAAAIKRALTDDGLVQRAAIRNTQIVRDQVDKEFVKKRVVAWYEQVFKRAGNHMVQQPSWGTARCEF